MANFVIVDDHPIVRVAIRLVLENAGHRVSAEAGDGDNIFSLVKEKGADAAIIDIDLPGIGGIEAVKNLRTAGSLIPVIVMSGKNAEFYAYESKKAGANGFISKKNNLNDLTHAVDAVLSGYGFFPLRLSHQAEGDQLVQDSDKLLLLSHREYEVLRYLGEGTEIVKIANRMKLSNKTVSTYKARLMEKLSLKNQKDLLDFTRRNQIN
ncbi:MULTISPECIES: response regulator [Pantoea]|jgi:two-component system, NarL family, response regulator EvgA|uniref:response regulator n=1 Tax=Pantoea TaxID=53335 RepID=UPI00073751A0|nr:MULTISPECIES: response regulator [Pantoea]KTR98720.1 transcriptional regulator [Pantoea dispersa]MDT8851105.1 response regulator [Pantoea dispersa]MEB5836834.1 response regulator [Pantoea dispersa]NIG13657.1 response regulator [Pantoea sp. Cy-640]OWS73972.1 DNA-binding response regulator [Pantoea sp. VS1]